MGTMTFRLPPNLSAEAQADLERAGIAGGQDCMPFATQVAIEYQSLVVSRSVDESGFLLVPWDVDGVGRLMVSSGTLMERAAPYDIRTELARGKINQLRSQMADWLMGGLVPPDGLADAVRAATAEFARALSAFPAPESAMHVSQALSRGCRAAHQLALAYRDQVFDSRHYRQPQLDTHLGCRLEAGVLSDEASAAFEEAFNAVCLPFPWADIEPTEAHFAWEAYDDRVNWALRKGMQIVGGPLIDFSGRGLPDWLWEKGTDLGSLCAHLCDYISLVVRRYHAQIRTWHLTAGSNCAGVVALGDEELLWLTTRFAETARRIDPRIELIIGIAQPWGDYLAYQDHNQSPLAFADMLNRTGMRLAAIDLELILGISSRGSYCRDLLDISRMLDLYALLGVPLQVTLGYPSAAGKDELACPEQQANAGHWDGGYTPETQADWAEAVASLCVCKPYVRAVHWTHFRDGEPHHFPHCGLIDAKGNLKPALQRLTALRGAHLK